MTETLASMVVDRIHLRWHDPMAIRHNRQSVLLRKSIMGSKSSYSQQVLLMVFFRTKSSGMFKAASKGSVLTEGSLSAPASTQSSPDKWPEPAILM